LLDYVTVIVQKTDTKTLTHLTGNAMPGRISPFHQPTVKMKNPDRK